MPNGTVTFLSNLTYNDNAGSTVTSATTTDTITGTAGTVGHISNTQQLTNVAASSALTVNLGSVDVTKDYCVRFRNTGWATTAQTKVTTTISGVSTIGAPCVEIILQTAISTFVPIARLYETETCGPIRMIPQTSGYPKLLARVTDSMNVTSGISPLNLEVIAGDLGAPVVTA